MTSTLHHLLNCDFVSILYSIHLMFNIVKCSCVLSPGWRLLSLQILKTIVCEIVLSEFRVTITTRHHDPLTIKSWISDETPPHICRLWRIFINLTIVKIINWITWVAVEVTKVLKNFKSRDFLIETLSFSLTHLRHKLLRLVQAPPWWILSNIEK